MFEFYPQIKHAHILLALSSGALFAIRGAASIMHAHWQKSMPVRLLSYTIDISLLTAAFMLLTILPGEMFENGWLLSKVILIVIYVLLALYSMRFARTRASQIISYIAALMVFLAIYSIARAHNSLGVLSHWST